VSGRTFIVKMEWEGGSRVLLGEMENVEVKEISLEREKVNGLRSWVS